MICAKSKFFAAACSKRWIEAKEKQVRLPDVHPPVFQSYLSWVYSTSLNTVEPTNDDIDEITNEKDRAVARYVELYLLGDALDDVHLRNRVMKTLVLDTTTVPCLQTVHRVWEHTPDSSLIRKMILDRAISRTKRAYLVDNLTQHPETFVQQVALTLLQGAQKLSREAFEAKLPSYLEPVEKAGWRR